MSSNNEEGMSYQEKRSIVYLISTLLIIWIYYIYVFQKHADKSLSSETDFRFWGITILLTVPAQIVVNIITHIVFNIINVIATRETGPSFADERDNLIELKANRNAYIVFMIGFLVSMGTLALDIAPYVMFHLLLASLFAASIMWSCSQFYFYRKGL
jgi:hypothetical protein